MHKIIYGFSCMPIVLNIILITSLTVGGINVAGAQSHSASDIEMHDIKKVVVPDSCFKKPGSDVPDSFMNGLLNERSKLISEDTAYGG